MRFYALASTPLGLSLLLDDTHARLRMRPEDIHLSETRPEGDSNIWQGMVDQKVFLGETADFQVAIGERRLQSRVHPSLRTRVGEPIYVRIDPEKCVALKQ